MSVEEFAAMPREEAVRFELVEGGLVPLAIGTPLHAWIRDGLVGRFRSYLDTRRIGIALTEVDCRIADDTVRRPDLSFRFRSHRTSRSRSCRRLRKQSK